ncbi:MAG: hypothetical protein EHM39_03220, partial [Chloroflexi bacterium]
MDDIPEHDDAVPPGEFDNVLNERGPFDPRGNADWYEAIGPEDEEDRDEIMDNLDAYGFNQMDEGILISNPTTISDMPDWAADDDPDHAPEIGEQIGEVHGAEDAWTDRPVEDIVIAELDDEAPGVDEGADLDNVRAEAGDFWTDRGLEHEAIEEDDEEADQSG